MQKDNFTPKNKKLMNQNLKISKPIVSIILGTRPEAIKLIPIIKSFEQFEKIEIRVITTGQHREMVNQVMELFNSDVDKDLNIMRNNQSLNYITIKVLEGLEEEFQKYRPSLVLVQGDTNTAFAGALCAFYKGIPIGHIEAGLRTNKLNDPFPEEGNRRLISQIASLHFAPTEESKANLLNSDVSGLIYVTGNTVIDSLFMIAKKALRPNYKGINWNKNKVIFVSVHRRENWGKRLDDIINGLKLILDNHSDVLILLPMHPNSVVRKPLMKSFKNNQRVILQAPLNYFDLVGTIKSCFLLLTDSGGLQEEAPALGKPVLVLRDTTERPEAVKSGTAKLIGTNPIKILEETTKLLLNKETYNRMSNAINPYGDGKASSRILKACKKYLNLK